MHENVDGDDGEDDDEDSENLADDDVGEDNVAEDEVEEDDVAEDEVEEDDVAEDEVEEDGGWRMKGLYQVSLTMATWTWLGTEDCTQVRYPYDHYTRMPWEHPRRTTHAARVKSSFKILMQELLVGQAQQCHLESMSGTLQNKRNKTVQNKRGDETIRCKIYGRQDNKDGTKRHRTKTSHSDASNASLLHLLHISRLPRECHYTLQKKSQIHRDANVPHAATFCTSRYSNNCGQLVLTADSGCGQ